MCRIAEEARAAVAAVRYPPRGVRGVSGRRAAPRGSAASPDYATRAEAELCLLVQVETVEAVARSRRSRRWTGSTGSSSDLGTWRPASGHLGAPGHPEVVAAIEAALLRIGRAGKPAGMLTPDRAFARRCLDLGALFVAVGVDAGVLARATEALAREFKG